MLQFHNTANMTKQIPDRFPLKQKPKIKNTELSLTSVKERDKFYYCSDTCKKYANPKSGRLDVPRNFLGTNSSVPGEYTGPMGTPPV